ncbi:hypothetical protein [Caulobacter sp. BP25]|uniref:hypothetical protein n=1 Tax=Caulobacter sp. BP25 TaxID=2048900 RepID=UPI000C12D811|nr:hypothetical protein [Caulobacter sp. BP25]PHY18474.1 hypothetical protein CSW59_17230 [Caulobacter sp. BP25]
MTSETDDWKERAYAAFVENLERQEALDRQGRAERGEFSIELLRAEGDPPVSDAAFQAELGAVTKALRDAGVPFTQTIFTMDAAEGHGYALPEIIMASATLGAVAIPALKEVLVAWIQGRNGRRTRLKVGDIEAEGRTDAEVEKLMKIASEFRSDDVK